MKKIYIVGAGPGDPDLITVKGLHMLQTADVVMYTDSLVSEDLIAKARPDAEVIRTAGMHLGNGCRDGGPSQCWKTVARMHTGDPAMYGAIMEQVALLKRKALGMKSFQELALYLHRLLLSELS